MRERILFDNDWLFHKGDIEVNLPGRKGPAYMQAKTESKKQGPASIYYNDAVDDFKQNVEYKSELWNRVSLPHDYIISGEMKEENNPGLGFFTYENGWYRKHFTLTGEDRNKRLTLYFEGVATRCTVYLNGCELKSNICGYSPFEVDITDYVKFDEDNVLAVYTRFDSVEGWWYQGGGIYRHVWLVKTENVAVDLYGVYAAPVYEDGKWTLKLETTVRNDFFEDKQVSIETKLIDTEGNVAAVCGSSGEIPCREVRTFAYETSVEAPVLWDLENPYLYRVVTQIKALTGSGKVGEELANSCEIHEELTDIYEVKTGFRYMHFDADKGFFLNGKHVFINGVCGHGDFGLTGKAVPDNIFRYKARLIKEMGANGYRATHYPQADAMMDACDELGILVMCEARWFHSTEDGKKQLTDHVKRDRNRPCVIMWSLGNEEPHHITETGSRINKNLFYEVKKLDKYRAVTSAVSVSPDKSTVYEYADIIGINYNHQLYEVVREAYPEKPIYASECCATSTTRGWYFDADPATAYCPAYDRDTNNWFIGREHYRKHIMDRPYVFGFFQWIAFEHRGEAIWPRICSQAGAIDLFMQKKDAFYQNRSQFVTEPMIHLMPHWNFKGLEGEELRVSAYTNCEEAELILNGQVIARQKLEPYSRLDCMVPYEPGRLECIGYRNGEAVAYDSAETTGAPVRLKMRLENPGDITANGQDIAMITCYCEDAQGRMVPDAATFVQFYSNSLGTVVGTGSDVSDHIPVTVTSRKMRAGAIGVAVKAGTQSGVLKVYAKAEGLDAAVLYVEI